MHFYLDESGTYTQSENPSTEFAFDCVASVVFNERAITTWNEKYANLAKGKDLNEEKAPEILQHLAKIGVKACIVGTNCKSYSKTIAEEHRDDYIRSIDTVTKGNHELLRESVVHNMGLLSAMHPQGYVKTMMIHNLKENTIRGVLEKASMYIIDDFSAFTWRCDHVSPKTYSTIKHLVYLQLNCSSRKKSVNCDDHSKIPNLINSDGKSLDATKILKEFDFQFDDECNGIKAADCFANFIRRIFRGKLILQDLSAIGLRSSSSSSSDDSSLRESEGILGVPDEIKPIPDLSNLKMIFDLPYSIELTHFNKDLPYIESQLRDYASFVLNNLNNNIELKESL